MNFESNNNTIEIDGICFETLLTEQNYQLPKYKEEIPIQFGVRIKNNSSNPYCFELPYFFPELSHDDGTLIKMDFGRNSTAPVRESDIPFINPGESLEFMIMYPKFVRYRYLSDDINLTGYAGYGGVWNFHQLKAGEYNIRLKYTSRNSKHKVHWGLEYREYDGFWVGEVLTPWQKLSLR